MKWTRAPLMGKIGPLAHYIHLNRHVVGVCLICSIIKTILGHISYPVYTGWTLVLKTYLYMVGQVPRFGNMGPILIKMGFIISIHDITVKTVDPW